MTKTDRVLSSFHRTVLLRTKALGLNQTQLAKRLDVARPYVIPTLTAKEVEPHWAQRVN